MSKKSQSNKGFTLVELIIAIAVFGILMVGVTSLGLSMIKSQRRAFALQRVEESGRYLLETMAKEIRMSLINTDSGDALSTLNITNSASETFDYFFDNTNKVLKRKGQVISPSEVEVSGSFYVRKSTLPDQAIVTMVMKVRAAGSKTEEQSEVYIQNTIAPRPY